MSKSYGLILPNKNKKTENVPPKADFTKPSIFGSDSESEDFGPKRPSASAIVPGVTEKRQARKIQEKALEQDPTIFQYDELYDEIENKRVEEKKSKTNEVKKAKYINRLLECAERRKIENKRRLERMVQKERELEGEQFKDKESFVTSAYRKTLEEFKKAEEREKREDYLEAIGDVTKQQDLGGFYRHLYEQKLGPKEIKNEETEEKSKSASPEGDQEQITSAKPKSIRPRTYRKRRSSGEDEEPTSATETQTSAPKKAHLQSNLDADSDFSIDSSSSDEDETQAKDKNKNDTKINANATVAIKQEPGSNSIPPISSDSKEEQVSATEVNTDLKSENGIKKEKNSEVVDEPKIEKKPKINKEEFWKKRTVGNTLEAALQRYYQRKASRNG